MGLQDAIRFLLPREDHFYETLEKQAKAAKSGATALARFARNETAIGEAEQALHTIEHEGDQLLRSFEESLAKTFVTPLDREDLHRLASELDRVLDLTYGVARTCRMVGLDRLTGPMQRLVDCVFRCMVTIDEVVPRLRIHRYAEIVTALREVRTTERDADEIYREAVSELFRDVPPADALVGAADPRRIMREKAVLDELENAVDLCNVLADTLTNVAIKHG